MALGSERETPASAFGSQLGRRFAFFLPFAASAVSPKIGGRQKLGFSDEAGLLAKPVPEKVSRAMFQKVGDAEFVRGEHEVLRFWTEENIFGRLREQNAGKPTWSFLDGPITANNPMGVHHAWGRTYKDAFQRYWAMNGRELRYQNGFDCQGLWVEVEVEKQLGLGAKSAIEEYGIDRFVWECKKRVLKYAAVQTEQSIRLGYWMDWDDPSTLRRLADAIGTDCRISVVTPTGQRVEGTAEQIVERLGNPDWGGSYFTFSTENNQTIWTFLKKCHDRGKIYRGHDVMPWSGKAGSAYSQMEVADGRRLTTHRALFVRFPIVSKEAQGQPSLGSSSAEETQGSLSLGFQSPTNEYLLDLDHHPVDAHQQRRRDGEPGPGIHQTPIQARQRDLLLREGEPRIPAARQGIQRRLRPPGVGLAEGLPEAEDDRADLQRAGRLRDRSAP